MTIDKFIQIMKKSTQGNQSLFHFTDTRNLPSIRQRGLLSANRRDRYGIKPVVTGGNEISKDADRWNSVRDYVHLCFFREHPLEYIARRDKRFIESTFLSIDPQVLYTPGVKVTFGVANKTGIPMLPVEEGLSQLDIDQMYIHSGWRNEDQFERYREAQKCEILIPNHVPVEMIRF